MKKREKQIQALCKILAEIAASDQDNAPNAIADRVEVAARIAMPNLQFTLLITMVGQNQLSLSHH